MNNAQREEKEKKNSLRRRAIFAAAGVDDGLVVIETAKGEFLPDGLPLIPLGLLHTARKIHDQDINKTCC